MVLIVVAVIALIRRFRARVQERATVASAGAPGSAG